jgi:protein ImuA
MTSAASAREILIATLRREVARLENCRPPEDERPVSTGSPALDCLLPAGGLRRGTLVEYLTSTSGSGAGTLALAAAREACHEGRALVVLDRPASCFYPLAAAAWGIDLSRLLVLRPANEADALWALDQALRCPGVGAVWARLDQRDVRDFRRLQLAAECGGTIGLLIRSARCRGQPTWADVQFEVRTVRQKDGGGRMKDEERFRYSSFILPPSSFAWQLSVELVRCRGAADGQAVVLELDEKSGVWREADGHATHSLSVVAELADSGRYGQTRRA